jgi:hypothetical protein
MIALQAVLLFPGDQTSLNPVGPGAAHIEHNFALGISLSCRGFPFTWLSMGPRWLHA